MAAVSLGGLPLPSLGRLLPLAAVLVALAAASVGGGEPASRCGAAAPGLNEVGAEELSSLLQGTAAAAGKRQAGSALAAGEVEFQQWSSPSRKKFKNKPRVRREWRTLSDETRKRVAGAFWTLKNTSTAVGRERYGPHFQNYDELLMLHVCSVKDPRCDQGHNGPQFMTFHRIYLLKVEMALLSVDSSIEALPYWDMAKDSVDGEYRNDPDRYIFTDKYFGSFQGQGPNYEVDDGLFANWPIEVYSPEKYGLDSALAEDGRCMKDQWFRGFTATTCNECCGKQDCECPVNANYTTYLRDHDDCAPHNVRWPRDPDCPNSVQLGGSYEIVYTEADFEACQQYPENVRSWMQWHNCQDPGLFFCNIHPSKLTSNSAFVETMQSELFPALLAHVRREMETWVQPVSSTPVPDPTDGSLEHAQELANHLEQTLYGRDERMFLAAMRALCRSPMIYGYYVKQNSVSRKYTNLHHGNAHFKLCRDFEDLSTSPNDVGPFTGHHSNIDRSNMHFMMDSYLADPSLEQKSWHFPASQSDLTGSSGLPPYGLGGPFSAAGLDLCTPDKATYPFYRNAHSPWTPGTLLDDQINAGYPFIDLFNASCRKGVDCSGRAAGGYSHRDVIYFTAPQRTPYTYDNLEHYYY